MKNSFILVLAAIVLLLFVPALLGKMDGVPKMAVVTPETARPGVSVSVTGEYLDAKHVTEVYITDGTTDWKVEILKQTEEKITFKIPADMRPGRFFLMVLTPEPEAMLIEQPVKLIVEPAAPTT